jgi:hypothetical protein
MNRAQCACLQQRRHVDRVAQSLPRPIGFRREKTKLVLRRTPVAFGARLQAVQRHAPVLCEACAHGRHRATETYRFGAAFVRGIDNRFDSFVGVERFADEQVLAKRGQCLDVTSLCQARKQVACGFLLSLGFQFAAERDLHAAIFVC